MTHVLHVSEVDFGGVMTWLRHVLPRLQRQGVANCVLLPETDARTARDAVDELVRGGVRVHQVAMRRTPLGLSPSGTRRIRRVLSEIQPDLLHTHSTFAGIWGRLALPRKGRTVASIHTPHAFAVLRMRGPLRRRFTILLERSLSRRTDAYALVSAHEAETAREQYGLVQAQLAVIPNGLPDDFVDRLLSRDEARRNLDIPREETVLLFPGRLEPQKGPDILVRALADVRHAALVLFAEAGAMEARLRHQLRGTAWEARCRFLGGRPSMRHELRAFDAVLLPSRYEGLPYSLLEALAAGLPIVASDVGGMRLCPPLDGRVDYIPAEDPHALAATINRLLASPSPLARPAPLPAPHRCSDQAQALRKLYTATIGSQHPPRKPSPCVR